jgi:hypothetical protein
MASTISPSGVRKEPPAALIVALAMSPVGFPTDVATGERSENFAVGLPVSSGDSPPYAVKTNTNAVNLVQLPVLIRTMLLQCRPAHPHCEPYRKRIAN